MQKAGQSQWINIAIQVLPEDGKGISYSLVDEAIRVIAESGCKYRVCPFETVVECTLDQGLKLIEAIHGACSEAGAIRMLTNIKIQSDFTGRVTIEDKMAKYD
jgi:uncharacterized protein YqgV (UPF0045/DUF77 family)